MSNVCVSLSPWNLETFLETQTTTKKNLQNKTLTQNIQKKTNADQTNCCQVRIVLKGININKTVENRYLEVIKLRKKITALSKPNWNQNK